MIKQECIGIPDMILLLMIFCFKKIKIKAEIVLSPGGAYFGYLHTTFELQKNTKESPPTETQHIPDLTHTGYNVSCRIFQCFDVIYGVSFVSLKRRCVFEILPYIQTWTLYPSYRVLLR